MKRWVFAAVAVVAGLLMIEGVLRLAGYRPLPTAPITRNAELLHQYGKFRSSATLTWELVPGWSGREGNGMVTINSRGLREREIPEARESGRRRILCLGDSVTFGHWVEAHETFCRLLEEELAGSGVETINAGVPGYSTFQEGAWLAAEGWRYDPDLIVLSFVLNDVVERYFTMAAYGGANTTLGVDTTVTLGPMARLMRRTAYHRFLTSFMARGARRREVYSVRRLFDDELTAEAQEAWEDVEAELADLVAQADEKGTPVLLVAFPFRFQIAENLPPRPQMRLAEWARRHDVPFLDLHDTFLRLGAQASFLDHDHPTPAGHRAAARAIARTIERLDLMQARAQP